jgi:hypothetical protein
MLVTGTSTGSARWWSRRTGFPLAYEVMDGNTSEHKTLRPFLETLLDAVRRAR